MAPVVDHVIFEVTIVPLVPPHVCFTSSPHTDRVRVEIKNKVKKRLKVFMVVCYLCLWSIADSKIALQLSCLG